MGVLHYGGPHTLASHVFQRCGMQMFERNSCNSPLFSFLSFQDGEGETGENSLDLSGLKQQSQALELGGQ